MTCYDNYPTHGYVKPSWIFINLVLIGTPVVDYHQLEKPNVYFLKMYVMLIISRF